MHEAPRVCDRQVQMDRPVNVLCSVSVTSDSMQAPLAIGSTIPSPLLLSCELRVGWREHFLRFHPIAH